MHLLPLLLVPTIVASAVIGVDGRLSSGQKRTKPFNATFSRPISTDTAYHNIPFQVVWSEPTSESAFRENITLRATYVDATGESELSMLARDLEGRTEVKNNGTFWWMPTSDMTPGLWSLSLNFPGYVQEDTISENFNIEAAPISAKDVDSEVVEAEETTSTATPKAEGYNTGKPMSVLEVGGAIAGSLTVLFAIGAGALLSRKKFMCFWRPASNGQKLPDEEKIPELDGGFTGTYPVELQSENSPVELTAVSWDSRELDARGGRPGELPGEFMPGRSGGQSSRGVL